ncbi:aryl-sulfate sulfotransferase [Rubellicoccus peritrichatus]|uniref:Aryl-sulfate sulfotransferase n=1 Tax=Rubellicoccus peritrichatus TaxID=3080537 RepID=A0AAQ3QUE1_9BACT|nr:aryl-sulfate sulfotransferase [Puniceicoccus sp. CR14]WOO39602.1 aryl-sulfate sulfotransferase [Puniceicoccus sp. CR14]
MSYHFVRTQIATPTLLSRFSTALLLAVSFLIRVDASSVDSVSPIYGTQGSGSVTVTVTLGEDDLLDADQNAVPVSVNLGDLSGTSIARTDTTTVTADFTIDADETLGALDLEVTFSNLNGAAAIYSKVNAFWVTEDEDVSDGYVLYAPVGETTTYLVDNDGETQKTWESDYEPGLSVYLMDDGTLIRTGQADNDVFGHEGGHGGIVENYDWDGDLLWTIEYSSDTYCAHHDIEVLPNGNVLLIAWQLISEDDAIAAGRDPSSVADDGLWADSIIEMDTDGNIVWEWYIWDHIVQDFDSTKDNYVDDVSEYPGLIDVNYELTSSDLNEEDWTHINSIDYNEELNQILVSVHNFSEVWIIDHSTTTEEAASSSGGNSGMGGQLLYRWGNPQAFSAGTEDDQILYQQHDATWIPEGYPGEGNILIYNNKAGKLDDDQDYTTVVEFTPALNDDGLYDFDDDLGYYGPESVIWTWQDDPPTDFYVSSISGAQRQSNGNTIITNGQETYVIEVNSDGDQVNGDDGEPWEYEYEGDSNIIFRFERYTSDFAGFDGTELDDESAAEQYFGVTIDDDECIIDVPGFGFVYICEWPYVFIYDQQSWVCISDTSTSVDASSFSLSTLTVRDHWVYDFILGWYWTRDDVYPWMFIVEVEPDRNPHWTYFADVIGERRYFYYVTPDQWRGHGRSGLDEE